MPAQKALPAPVTTTARTASSSLARVKAAGVQIVEVDKKSFQSVMAPVYEKFMTTPDMKRVVKAVQDIK